MYARCSSNVRPSPKPYVLEPAGMRNQVWTAVTFSDICPYETSAYHSWEFGTSRLCRDAVEPLRSVGEVDEHHYGARSPQRRQVQVVVGRPLVRLPVSPGGEIARQRLPTGRPSRDAECERGDDKDTTQHQFPVPAIRQIPEG